MNGLVWLLPDAQTKKFGFRHTKIAATDDVIVGYDIKIAAPLSEPLESVESL
jgi:hypothetical protein